MHLIAHRGLLYRVSGDRSGSGNVTPTVGDGGGGAAAAAAVRRGRYRRRVLLGGVLLWADGGAATLMDDDAAKACCRGASGGAREIGGGTASRVSLPPYRRGQRITCTLAAAALRGCIAAPPPGSRTAPLWIMHARWGCAAARTVQPVLRQGGLSQGIVLPRLPRAPGCTWTATCRYTPAAAAPVLLCASLSCIGAINSRSILTPHFFPDLPETAWLNHLCAWLNHSRAWVGQENSEAGNHCSVLCKFHTTLAADSSGKQQRSAESSGEASQRSVAVT